MKYFKPQMQQLVKEHRELHDQLKSLWLKWIYKRIMH